jgi:tetratricopeptide (TPR) repeat protein
MIKPLRLFFLWMACLVFFAVACKEPGNRKDDRKEEMLNRPPFASLTDSIRQSKGSDEAILYERRGELLSRNNLHELAAGDFKKSWELRPDEATGFRYASTLSIIGQTAEAISVLQDCRQRFPGNPSFSSMLGDIYVQSNKVAQAMQLYDTILKSDSLNFEAWYEKGLLLERAKDTAGAIEALGKAYTLQPVNTYALELAHMYAENRNKLALRLCDEVLDKDSARELLDPLFIKGIYYSNTAQYKKAMDEFDSCIRRDWKFTDAYLEKGIAQFKQQNYQEAKNTFTMTIRVSNTYPDGYYWIGRCYEALGSTDDAIQYYQRALSLDKEFTEAADRIRRLK